MTRPMIGILGQAGSGKDTFADHLELEHDFLKIALADPMKRFVMKVFDIPEEYLWGPSELRNQRVHRLSKARTIWSRMLRHNAIREIHWDRAEANFNFFAYEWVRDLLFSWQEPQIGQAVGRLKKDWFDRLRRESTFSCRTALQLLGTEWGRYVDDQMWVRKLLATIQTMEAGNYFYTGPFGLTYGPGHLLRGFIVTDLRFKNEVMLIRSQGGVVGRLKRNTPKHLAVQGVANHASEEEQKSIPDGDLDFVLAVPEGLERYYAAIDAKMEELCQRGLLGVSKKGGSAS